MLIINTASDLTVAKAGEERTAFLTSLLNDYVAFDDAVYPADYDKTLQPSDDGYIVPVLRQEWNAGAAASWGFMSREQIEAALTKAAGVPWL